MATKVKGDAIKEGSIPLSALSNEVKDKIENAGGGADWNAQEGEAGYIKNKPFYTKGDTRQIDVDGEYTIVVGEFNIGDRIDISWDLICYNDEIFRGSTSFVIQEDGEEPTYYYQENDFYIRGGKTFEMYAYGGGDSHYGKVTYTVNGEVKTIDKKYLPTLNWNAKEGEPGYIENKPFNEERVDGYLKFSYTRELDMDTDAREYIYAGSEDTKNRIQLKNNMAIYYLENYNIDSPIVISKSVGYGGHTFHDSLTINIINYEEEDFVEFIMNDDYGDLRIEYAMFTSLDASYLPETVIKTTPQTLSDTDKNQALANLGIDPIVLKYLCNPIIITSLDDRLPTDILKDDGTGVAMILPKYAGLIRGGYDSRKQQYVNACAVKSEENGFWYSVYIGGDLNITASIEFDGSLYYDDI